MGFTSLAKPVPEEDARDSFILPMCAEIVELVVEICFVRDDDRALLFFDLGFCKTTKKSKMLCIFN